MKLSQADLQEIMNEADLDEDGKISFSGNVVSFLEAILESLSCFSLFQLLHALIHSFLFFLDVYGISWINSTLFCFGRWR